MDKIGKIGDRWYVAVKNAWYGVTLEKDKEKYDVMIFKNERYYVEEVRELLKEYEEQSVEIRRNKCG